MGALALQKLEYQGEGQQTRPRVLYAEDQQTSRIVTAALLKRLGYDVVAVEDGELALAKARIEKFDLILLDIEMPVMDGVIAARSIRAEDTPNTGVPILALSAFLADSTENTNWRGVFDFALPKPANQDELRRAIGRVTQSKSQTAPKLTREEILSNLRGSLPRTVWGHVLTGAHAELRHLANAIGACREAGDVAAVKKCTSNLISLAQSFEARDVVLAATPHADEACSDPVTALLAAIEDWHVAARSA
jgi:CheY-like chemotaxis protein